MSKESLLVAALAALALCGMASACIGYPTVQDGSGCNISFQTPPARVRLTELYQNETAVVDILNQNKAACGFSDEDISIVKDFVLNGYTVRKQTDAEYQAFLKQASDENARRPADCMAYTAVAHRGSWTGYGETGYLYNSHGCMFPMCASASLVIVWNDLVAAPLGGSASFGSSDWIAYLLVAVVLTGLFVFLLKTCVLTKCARGKGAPKKGKK